MTIKATVKEQAEILKSGATYQAVKKHVKKHKTKYAVGTTIVVTSGVTFLVTRRVAVRTITVAPVFNNNPVIAPVINNVVNNGGHMTKIVRCVETGEIWLSVTEAAEATGNGISTMSRHLNGKTEHLKDGLHYVIEGVRTAG